MRGFGRSSAPKEVTKYGSKNATSDLARLLDILEIPKAVFIGHDWGGSFAWRMCLYHPDRVLAVRGICLPYLPPTQEPMDVGALVAMFPNFAYQRLLSQTDLAAEQLNPTPRRFFSASFRYHHELVDEKTFRKIAIEDLVKNAPMSDSPAYTQRSALLTKEELDFYKSEYAWSGLKARFTTTLRKRLTLRPSGNY